MVNFIIESAHYFNAAEEEKKTKPKSNRLSWKMQFFNRCTDTMVVESAAVATAATEIIKVFLYVWKVKFFEIAIMLSFHAATAAKCETLGK